MDILSIIKNRRAVRNFKDLAIEAGKIDALKDALIWAPSAGNLQSRLFYFVFNREMKKGISKAAFNQRFISEAPLVVVGCADLSIGGHYGERGVTLYSIQDVACSLENLMLEAHSLGLGTVWVGAFDEEEVRGCIGIPGNLRPVAIAPVGYPLRTPQAPKRISREKAVIEVI